MSRGNKQSMQNYANLSGNFVNGWGPGIGATTAKDRDRDVAAYEAQRAKLPKKPPRIPVKPEEP